LRAVRAFRAIAVGLAIAGAACSNPFGRQYEYEEQVYLRVDGAATVVVDSSISALVALRGVALDPAAPSSTDRANLRAMFEAAGCHVDNVGQPWRRRGRRFVQVRISTPDVRALSKCGLLSWSSYTLSPNGDGLHFHQVVGPPSPRDPGQVNWDGSEMVAFKLHAPSRVREHNIRRLDVDEPGEPERGNILTWEQRLGDRRAGKPVEMDVKMDATSILYTTLWLFGGAAVAAVGTLAFIVWMTVRRGRKRVAARQS
jgi:hypothetical protein